MNHFNKGDKVVCIVDIPDGPVFKNAVGVVTGSTETHPLLQLLRGVPPVAYHVEFPGLHSGTFHCGHCNKLHPMNFMPEWLRLLDDPDAKSIETEQEAPVDAVAH